eukprot:GEMP01029895.1.p1 GENE.GEMP01029895.1~~GEMP01029895.1.p1  ORF type:complete len:624 (+),score=109.36 GEMP01029895.1:220-2091(+)
MPIAEISDANENFDLRTSLKGHVSAFQELRDIWREFRDTFRWNNIRSTGYPLWRKGDTDAFFALWSDNLGTQLLLISLLIMYITPENASPELIAEIQLFPYRRILPGLGISLFVGNVYYFLQASKVARRTGNVDTCALPYGINTPGAFPKLFSILLVVYRQEVAAGVPTMDAIDKAWKVATACNFLSGLFEIAGAFVAPLFVHRIHSAVLLAPIAGIGLAWLTFEQIKNMLSVDPLVGFLPFIIVWYGTFSNGKLGRIPMALVAIVVGSLAAWIVGVRTVEHITISARNVGFYGGSFGSCFEYMNEVGEYISLLLPIAMTNALGTLECVRSAAESGDIYNSAESMIVDGVGSILGALFGSPFGTTVYIGHSAYKKFGAGRGYSLMNGIVYLVFGIFGFHSLIAAFIPPEAVLGVIAFVGLMIAKQTIELTPPPWLPAILVGCIPPFASVLAANGNNFSKRGALGISLLEGGYLFTSLLWTVAFIAVTDRKLLHAAGYWGICALLATFGVIHSKTLGIMDKTGTIGNVCDGEKSESACRWAPICNWKGDSANGSCGLLDPGLPGYKFVVTYVVIAAFCLIGYFLQRRGWTDAPILDPLAESSDLQVKETELNATKSVGGHNTDI